uniref:Polycystin cation channel PKD1/PKD2 domain-containing protein n=1 Tax=Eutreptiella gymnastica TaxID=73025 RepID=A0A7S1J2R3_9EUGL|mmetsp:Transcript_62523/g.111400  ORF Transcript_62523/g.111400 Transcript_62523/m.111400 type:complete len:769 (+) Transcript_62523:188-2494(+)
MPGDDAELDIGRESKFHKEQRAKKKQQRINESKLPVVFVLKQLDRQARTQMFSREFMQFVPFWIVFLVLCLKSLSSVYFLNLAVENTTLLNTFNANIRTGPFYQKTIHDDPSPLGFYQYLVDVMWPHVWNAGPSNESITPRYVAGVNQLIGAVRIRQWRVRSDSCTIQTSLAGPGYPPNCYGPYTYYNSVRAPFIGSPDAIFPYRKSEWAPCLFGYFASYCRSSYDVTLPANYSADQALEVLNGLKINNYLDSLETRAMSMEFYTYVASRSFAMHSSVLCEQSPGGSWTAITKVRAFQIWNPDSLGDTIVDTIFLLYCVQQVYTVIRAWKGDQLTGGGTFGYWQNVWHITEAISILFLFLQAAMRWVWVLTCMGIEVSLPESSKYPDFLYGAQVTFYTQLWLLSLNIVFNFVRLSKYAPVVPAFRVLSLAIEKSQVMGFAVSLMMMILIIAFSFSAMLVFGDEVYSFKDFASSMSTMLLVLMGDYDYDEMKDTQATLAAFLFIAYNVGAIFILLNLLLTVLGNSFSEAYNVIPKQRLHEVILAKGRMLWLYRENPKKILELLKPPKTRPTHMTLRQYLMLSLVQKGISKDIHLTNYGRLPEYKFPNSEMLSISRDELRALIPPVEVDDMGLGFFELAWATLVTEYDTLSAMGDTTLNFRSEKQAIYKGLKGVLNGCFPPLFKHGPDTTGLILDRSHLKQSQADHGLAKKNFLLSHAEMRAEELKRYFVLDVQLGPLGQIEKRYVDADLTVQCASKLAAVLEGRLSTVI